MVALLAPALPPSPPPGPPGARSGAVAAAAMAAPGPAEPRILSMQSHVVQGYVGNRCAAFTLQAFGLDVGVINTVQFSNHTGYPFKTGTVLGEAALQDLVDGLKANRLADYTHIVTGSPAAQPL